MASVPIAMIIGSRSTCGARMTRRRIARRRLPGSQRLAALDPQESLGDAVIDEVPRQPLVLIVCAMNVCVGRRQLIETVALPDANDAPPIAARRMHCVDETGDAAIATREHGLQVRFAR